MKTRTIFWTLLVISAVIVSGCLGSQAPAGGQQQTTPDAGYGNIPNVADSGTGMAVDTPADAAAESVNLGTLI